MKRSTLRLFGAFCLLYGFIGGAAILADLFHAESLTHVDRDDIVFMMGALLVLMNLPEKP